MSIFDEAQQLEELAVIAKSLVKYSISLQPGLYFERSSGWWVPPVNLNFVGFKFCWTDVLSITINVYGNPEEQFQHDDFSVRKSKFNYSKCQVFDENQLMAASVCIWRAHQLFHRPREIESSVLTLTDEGETAARDWLRPRPLQNSQPGSNVMPWPDQTSLWYDEVREFMKINKINDYPVVS